MLKQTQRAARGDAQRTRFHKVTESPPPLKKLKLDKKTSQIAKKLAELPQPQFEQVREGASTITRCDDLQYHDGPLLTLHQIHDHLPQTLVFSIRDPNEDQPEYLAAYPLNACRLNYERPF